MTLNNLTHAHAQSLTLTQHAHALSQTLRQQLIATHASTNTDTDIKNTKAIDRYLKNHIETIIQDLHSIYVGQRHKHYSECYAMVVTDYRKWGQLTLNGKKVWADSIIMDLLIKKYIPGFPGVASAIKITNIYVLNAINEYGKRFVATPVTVTSEHFINTKCNRKALEVFIAVEEDQKALKQAKTILASLDKDDLFKQEIKQPVVNRVYLLGLNLQQVKKEVRAAALSGQWAYDVNCAVFALFASVAHELTDTPYYNLYYYVHNRTEIRKFIADETGLTVDQVKQALISVGFGARAKVSDNLAVVMTTRIGKNIVDEFRKASSIIYKHFKHGELTRGKQLAELFFTWESEFINEFSRRDADALNLTIYDCAIFTRPLRLTVKNNLSTMRLSYTSHKEYFDVEETQI